MELLLDRGCLTVIIQVDRDFAIEKGHFTIAGQHRMIFEICIRKDQMIWHECGGGSGFFCITDDFKFTDRCTAFKTNLVDLAIPFDEYFHPSRKCIND